MKRVLVTGASGFLGRTTVEPLSQRGFEIVGVSRHPSPQTDGVEWHPVNLLNPDDRQSLFQRVQATHLLHFAWDVTPGDYVESPRNQDWAAASRDLLEEFARHGGQRAVLSGTCLEYDWTAPAPFNERTTPLAPTSLYGTCKNQLRMALEVLTRSSSLTGAWGRIFHCFGPHEKPERLVPHVIQSLLANEVARCSHGFQVCDFMDSRDIGEAFVALLDSEASGAINIASGQAIRVRDLVGKIAEDIGKPELVTYDPGPEPNETVPEVFADVSRLRNELRWSPSHSLDDRLGQVIEWWKERESVTHS